MPESSETKQLPTKADLISHWRSTANEIRSEIAAAGLENETQQIAQTTADLLEACASQLESLPTH